MRPIELFRAASFRIAIWYAALFAVSVAALGAVMIWLLTTEMATGIHRIIDQQSAMLLSIYSKQGWSGLRQEIEEQSASAASYPKGDHYLLLDRQGRRLAGDLAAMPPFIGWNRVLLPRGGKHAQKHADRRTLSVPLFSTALPEGYLIVGHSRHMIDKVQDILVDVAAWGLLMAVLLALAGGFVMSRRILRWVEEINHATSQIMEGDLGRRLPILGVGDEFDGLSRNINGMLDRIEKLMEDLRQTTNDIAHDLRTPLTRLQHGLASAMQGADRRPADRAAFDKAIHETESILDTFDALLRIAEIEAGARRTHFAGVDLSSLTQELVETYSPVAEENGQHLAGDIDGGATLSGDKGLLTQLLVNLIENSIQHAGHEARITLTVRCAQTGPQISVADTGPGIPVNERSDVLKRFYRLDRSRTTPGSGLGLALVKAVADLHQLQLELADNSPGLLVRVSAVAHGSV